MAHQEFDRFAINMDPLSSRDNKKRIEQDHVPIDQKTKKPSMAPGKVSRGLSQETSRLK
ncbi:MAG: hypothetical protein MK165_09300 [Pirellulaceae bacterium]|nr:hypothetical protein [Pirellulaceae bacterium]